MRTAFIINGKNYSNVHFGVDFIDEKKAIEVGADKYTFEITNMTSNLLEIEYKFANASLISAYSPLGLDQATMRLNTLEVLKCADGRLFKDNHKKIKISIP